MGELNSQITALLSFGADAMDNMFDVSIQLPVAVSNAIAANPELRASAESFRVRCQGFDPPHFMVKTYDVPYKTVRIKKPAGRIDGDRLFKLQFRIDAYYFVYRSLLAWKSLVMQAATGFAATQASGLPDQGTGESGDYGKILVVALDTPIIENSGGGYLASGVTDGDFTNAAIGEGLCWSFENVWLVDLEDPKYKTGSGESMLATATFAFGNYSDPYLIDAGQGRSAVSTTKSKYGIVLE